MHLSLERYIEGSRCLLTIWLLEKYIELPRALEKVEELLSRLQEC